MFTGFPERDNRFSGKAVGNRLSRWCLKAYEFGDIPNFTEERLWYCGDSEPDDVYGFESTSCHWFFVLKFLLPSNVTPVTATVAEGMA